MAKSADDFLGSADAFLDQPSGQPRSSADDFLDSADAFLDGEDSWTDVGRNLVERSGHGLNADFGGIEQTAAVAGNAPGQFAGNTVKGINRLVATGLAYVAPGSAARGRLPGGDPLIRAAGNVTPSSFTPESEARVKADPLFQKGADRFAYHTERAEELKPNVDPWSAKGIASAAGEAVLTSVLSAMAAGTLGGVVAGLSPMAAQVYGQKIGEMVKAGKPLAEAQDAAGFAVLSEVVPEAVPLGYALKAGTPFWRRIFGTAWREGAEEQITEAMQIEWDKNKGQDISLKDALNRIAYAGTIGAVTGASMGAIGGAGKGPQSIPQTTPQGPGGEPIVADDFLDGNATAEDILGGAPQAGGIGQRALPAPRIIVSPTGEAVPESKMQPAVDLGQGEVSGAKQGRAPLPDLPAEQPTLALPPPKMVGTPEGVVGTQAQVEAAQRTKQDLGTGEVADAVHGRAPLPDVGQGELIPARKEPADLLKTIAAAGGLSRDAAQADGVDPANFKEQKYRTMIFGKPLFPKHGGMGMDQLAELLSQIGYLPEGQYQANDALELVHRALRGEKIYTQENAGDAAERAAQRHEVDQREQYGKQPSDTGIEYRAGDLRSRMAEAGRNRVKNTLGAEAALNWQPKPDDFGLSGYSKESEENQDLSAVMFDGRKIMGNDAFEAFFERFSEQNADIDGAAFESRLSEAIRSQDNAQKPGNAEADRGGTGRIAEAVRSGNRQAQETGQAKAGPASAAQAVATPASTAQPPAAPQRRTDAATRQKIADMSPDDMRRELLTDTLTGLPNRRAYDEAEKKAVQVAIDLDNLKWLNDAMGHESGDKALAALGQALRESGLEAYHISGDEFMVQGDDRAAIEKGMAAVRARLDAAVIHVEHQDGSTTTKTGVHFSFGIGATRNEADTALNADKASRQASGRRAARGEAPGGVERRAKGQPDNQDRPAGQEVTPEQPADGRAQRAGTETPPQGGVSLSAADKAQPSPQSELFAENVTGAIKATAESTKAVADAVSGLKEEVAGLKQEITGQGAQRQSIDLLADPRLAGITVRVNAVESETGRKISYDEQADVALRDVDERLTLARRLAECLAS
jgi:diguanylate cyclase (GGDEF)-like protein